MPERLYAVSILAYNRRTETWRHYATSVITEQASDPALRAKFLTVALMMPSFDPSDGWTNHDVRWDDATSKARSINA